MLQRNWSDWDAAVVFEGRAALPKKISVSQISLILSVLAPGRREKGDERPADSFRFICCVTLSG